MHNADFTKQAQARRAEHVVDGLGGRAGPLPHALAQPAIETITCAIVKTGGQLDPGAARSAGDHRRGEIRCVVGQRHVWPVTQFRGQRDAAVGFHCGQAQPIQADVLGERGGVRRPLPAPGKVARQAGVACVKGQVRQARVVVDEVQRRLGIVERRQHLAQGEAELATVRRRFVAP
ncbi:hypothetical protein D3C72_1788380 [compost metagenome]